MLCTDMRQSSTDYRFLATVMGIYPLLRISEGPLFENQTTHFVVFEPNRGQAGAWEQGLPTFWCLSVTCAFCGGKHVRIAQTYLYQRGDFCMARHATKIVATLGPASSDPALLEQMIRAGVNVVRLNFSHGKAQDHIDRAKLVREAAQRAGREVAILSLIHI